MDLQDPTKISPELAKILGYNTTVLQDLQLPATRTIKPDLQGATKLAFLGMVQPYHQRTAASELNENQRRQLLKLGIRPRETHYHMGLITTRLRDERGLHSPNVVKLHDYLVEQVQTRDADDRGQHYNNLVAVLEALNQRLRSRDNLDMSIQMVMAERDLVLAQIGSLFLHPEFYRVLDSPTTFLEHTAPSVGLFAMAVATCHS